LHNGRPDNLPTLQQSAQATTRPQLLLYAIEQIAGAACKHLRRQQQAVLSMEASTVLSAAAGMGGQDDGWLFLNRQ